MIDISERRALREICKDRTDKIVAASMGKAVDALIASNERFVQTMSEVNIAVQAAENSADDEFLEHIANLRHLPAL